MSAGTLGQFLLYSILAAGSLGTLSEVWGEISQAAGAAERLTELIDEVPAIAPPANPKPTAGTAGRIRLLQRCALCLSGAAGRADPERPLLFGGARRDRCHRRPLRRRKRAPCSHSSAGFYDPQGGSIELDGVNVREADPAKLRNRLASVPQDVAIFASSVKGQYRIRPTRCHR